MKGRVIALDQIGGRDAAALIVDGVLLDIVVDPAGEAPLPGAILRGIVDRPMKGQGGVFVKLPGGQSGFLRQVSGLAPGQPVLVQLSGAAEPGKALPVTTRLLFKGRYAIITPGAPGRNISRRIRDEDMRNALESLAEAGMEGAPADLGLILRSACAEADEADIADDILAMRDLSVAVLSDIEGGPELLVDGASAHETAWRDWTDPAPDDVAEGEGAFEAHGVEELIDALLSPRVPLPGGAHMYVEPTRALVAVDVNTGNDTTPAASLKANIAAARDLPRQLRLRGLGGQVVVDFAPMPKKDRAVLDQVLRAAFKGESSETSLSGWTNLGLYELVRKRDRLPLAELLGVRE
ncbi:ribonuclease, Rne/Rng family [Gemmobacter aquatilis]|uniref:Ribonuclease, Rne/Rng family n=1 Tax=Gemmobacter aquatilis TaxID=933059 RepID=A0A1H7Z6P7_9RHOB|nr:ribonuclease E/G [Gemmobacter aquatilis]SEM53955.1 ribonuclease, Rne/Rng family [Gemmobacter aquatilis]